MSQDIVAGSEPRAAPPAAKADEKVINNVSVAPTASEFSWLDPHPLFVVILVGSTNQPFGIQKDFLMAKSAHYRKLFAASSNGKPSDGAANGDVSRKKDLDAIVRLPNMRPGVFAFAQNFMYTDRIVPTLHDLPTYEILVELWKLGHELEIDGLCDRTIETLKEVRQHRQTIPDTLLLVKAWKETPDNSDIRKLMLTWAAEHMRSSETRTEFAKSLPQEILSELVVVMSALEAEATTAAKSPAPAPTNSAAQWDNGTGAIPSAAQQARADKIVHYLDDDDDSDEDGYVAAAVAQPPLKKIRHSDVLPNGNAQQAKSTGVGKPRGRPPGSTKGPVAAVAAPEKRRVSLPSIPSDQYPVERRLEFCADLLVRMLSGPGFWTRLVGPFRDPVDPKTHGIPDYFEKVTKPMDLSTMRKKMDAGGYTSDADFLADMNQIFTNCYTYWTRDSSMYASCEKLENTFRDKYSQMSKWIGKMHGGEEKA